MAQFNVRQRMVYYEDFVVEAESAEQAVQLVNDCEVVGKGPEYLETTAIFLTDGVFALKDQPENATV